MKGSVMDASEWLILHRQPPALQLATHLSPLSLSTSLPFFVVVAHL